MSRFNQCPNCGATPAVGFFGGSYFKILKCKKCGTLYCYNCGDKYCPNCGSQERSKAGECWGPKKK